MSKKQKQEKIVSPRGEAAWPWLTGKPDTEYKPEGTYHVALRLKTSEKTTQEFVEMLRQRHAKAVENAKSALGKKFNAKKMNAPPFSEELDKDEKPTGYTLVRFKSTASGVNAEGEAWERKPKLFDAKNNPLPDTVRIGGGSEIKVSFSIFEWDPAKNGAGISLRLLGVKVLKLVEWTGGGASSMGFEEEEGYSFQEKTPDEDSDGDDEAEGGDDGDAEEGDY